MTSLLERLDVPASNKGAGPIRTKSRNGSRPTTPYSRPPKGDVNSAWTHDMFDDSLSARLGMDVPTGPRKTQLTGVAQKAFSALQDRPSRGGLSIKGAAQPPSANVIEVSGLVSGTTEDDVSAIFSQCGAIVSTESEGTRSNVCIRLTFKEPSSAQKAVEKFNGQQADGKTISVKLIGSSTAKSALTNRFGIDLVKEEGSVDMLIDGENTGSKMRSDALIYSAGAHVLVAPPGTDPKDYVQASSRGGRRGGRGRGRGGRGRGGGTLASRMDVD